MKINLESLINTVQCNTEKTEKYYKLSKSENWCKLKETERIEIQRSAKDADSFIRDLTEILQIDIINLYIITRLIRKWYKKRNWQDYFDINDNYNNKKIVNYLKNKSNEQRLNWYYDSTGRKKRYIQ